MALTFIPREKNAVDRFTEGFAPYLQMAMETMYKNKIAEQQRQKAIQELGIGQEQLTPQGEQYVKSLPLSAPIYQGVNPGQQPLSSIPKKYKTMGLDMNKASQIPINMDMGGGVQYKSPAIDPYTAMIMKQYGFGGQTENVGKNDANPMGTPMMKDNLEVTGISLGGGKPKINLKNENILTPALQKQKIKDTNDLFSTIKTNQVKKDNIEQALLSAEKIPAGIMGKARITYMKSFDPNNPVMTDWQNVKSVLTDSQLLYTAKTKGAISDREMDLFSEAAANDDMGAISRIKPALNRLMSFLDAEEESKKQSYISNYGSLPNESSLQQPTQPQGIPEVGQSFNGERVINVQRIE